MGMAEATMMTTVILTDTTTGTQLTTATEAIMTTIGTEVTMETDTIAMVLIDTTMGMTGMEIMDTITTRLTATTKATARFHFSLGGTEVMADTVLLTTAHPTTIRSTITVVWL